MRTAVVAQLRPHLFAGRVREGAPDLDRAANVVAELAAQEDTWYTADEIGAAFSLAADDAMVARILRILDEDSGLNEPASLLGSQLRDLRLRRIVQQAILAKNKTLLHRLAVSTRLVTALDIRVPEPSDFVASTSWVDRYPLPLREPLHQLSRVVNDAPTVALALLAKDFPDEARLRQEIVAIRERIASADREPTRRHLEKRVANLEQRLGAATTVSARRLDNLVKRVWDRVDFEVVAGYLRSCQHLAARQLQADYGTGELPTSCSVHRVINYWREFCS